MTKLKYTLEAEIETENQLLKIEITDEQVWVRDESKTALVDMFSDDFERVIEIYKEYKAATGGKQ